MIMWNGVIALIVILAATVYAGMSFEHSWICVIVAALAGGYIGHITALKDT